jgi:multiple sugar transport system permease protein
LLWLAGFLLFTLYPIWATLYFNFTNRNVPSALHWVRLPNYASLLADRDDF